jgi:hypothetical protein
MKSLPWIMQNQGRSRVKIGVARIKIDEVAGFRVIHPDLVQFTPDHQVDASDFRLSVLFIWR